MILILNVLLVSTVLILLILNFIKCYSEKYIESENVMDRIKKVESIIVNLLKNLSQPDILDVGGKDFIEVAKNKNWNYVTIDLEKPQSVGTGGHQSLTTFTYDGKTLPFNSNSFDLVNVGFVLHHAAENTLGLLKQIKDISRKYVIIGEDLAEQDYPMSWHERNWKHHPGGLFRSDTEWRQLFSLIGYKLISSYKISSKNDPDQRVYRVIYILYTY